MPEEDVSDLRDVVDAINKLCETMKTSYDEYEDCDDTEIVDRHELDIGNATISVDTHVKERRDDTDTIATVQEPIIFEHVKNVKAEEKRPMEPGQTIESWSDIITDISVPLTNTKETELEFTLATTESVLQETHRAKNWTHTFKEPDMSSSEPLTQNVETCVIESDMIIKPVVFTSECIATEVPQSRNFNDIEVFRNIVTEKKDRVVEEIELVTSDTEQVPCEPMSEMYYTASSEVSLLSDIDMQEKAPSEDSDKERDDRNSVIAGHVAAMRERFESMTRTNTPCPDLIRSASPSFEVFRNISTSPDHLG